MSKYLLILLILASTKSDLKGQQLLWHNIKIDQNDKINFIGRDTIGFVWLIGDDKLYRFDGASATPMLTLHNGHVTDFYSTDSLFYLGTEHGEAWSYNPYINELEQLVPATRYRPVTSMAISSNEDIVLAYYGQGISIYTKDTIYDFDTQNGLVSNEVYDIAFWNNRYYVATDQGIQTIDLTADGEVLEHIGVADGLADVIVTHLHPQQSRLVYSDYDSSVGFLTKNHAITNIALPSQDRMLDIVSMDQDALLIVTAGCLWIYQNGNWSCRYKTNERNYIKSAVEDEEHNIWLLDNDNNLIKGSRKFLHWPTTCRDLRTVSHVNNRLYLGGELGFFRQVENGEHSMLIETNVVYSTVHNGHIYVGTFSDGIYVFDHDGKFVQHLSGWDGFSDQSVLYIYGLDSELFVSTLSGVTVFDISDGELRNPQSLTNILGSRYVYCILSNGSELLFGTDKRGIISWDRDQAIIRLLNEDTNGDKIGSVYAMAQDDRGVIWLTSTAKGLLQYNHGVLASLPNNPGELDHYTGVSCLSNGSLLLVRANGIDVFEPLNQHFLTYDKELNLKAETAYLNTVFSNKDTTFFIHDDRVFQYCNFYNNKIHPQVIIDQVSVNLQEVTGRKLFKESENNFGFDFKGCWMTDPTKIIYQYRLRPYDVEYRVTKDDYIIYPNLPPGTYNFSVKASENGAFYQVPEAEYSFTISRSWYKTLWFKSLLALVLISGVVYGNFQLSNRRKQQLLLEKLSVENQLIQLKNQLNPHFLFNAFNTLAALIEEDQDKSVVFVEKLSIFYRRLLEHGNASIIPLAQEIEMLELFVDILKVRFAGQLEVNMNIHDLEGYSLPPLTLQLLIENVVKHNAMSSSSPMIIDIVQNKSRINVSNPIRPLFVPISSTQQGLSNLKKRFLLAGLEEPIIKKDQDIFSIIINVRTDES